MQRQRAADEAHTRVRDLLDSYGSPTAAPWSETRTDTYETAWRAWRDLARDTQAAVTEHARAGERPRSEIEAEVKRTAREPAP